MPYTDPPEVLRLADLLATLPRWYLALMLARTLNRKAAHRADEGDARREAVVRTTTGGEVVHSADALSAGREARSAPSVASSI